MEGIINERVCGMKMIHLERKKMTIVFKKKKKFLRNWDKKKYSFLEIYGLFCTKAKIMRIKF